MTSHQIAMKNQRLEEEHERMRKFLKQTDNFLNNSVPREETKIRHLETIKKDIHFLQKIKLKAEQKLKESKRMENITSEDYYKSKHMVNFRMTFLKLQDHNIFWTCKYVEKGSQCKYCSKDILTCQICFFQKLATKNFIGSALRFHSLLDFESKGGNILKLEKGYTYALKILRK